VFYRIRRLPQYKTLEHIGRLLRPIRPWCERIALVIAVSLAYTKLHEEIWNWRTLFAASTPLAVLNGWSGGFVVRRVRRYLRKPRVTLWISAAPDGHEIIVSGPVGLTLPAIQSAKHPDTTLPIGQSQHCVLFAVDIVQFTGRDDEVQLALREALYRLLIESFDNADIPWRSCVHEDRGDGAIVVIPAHMPTITVVGPLVEQIRVRLRRHNRLSSPVAQVRLRLAVHIGEVYRDPHGLAGKAVNHLFRMLDAPNLRQALQTSDAELALIVSDYLYESVIHGAPDAAAYSQVTVRVKQFEARAWLLGVPE
jgi:class 3 adenylate cyclase